MTRIAGLVAMMAFAAGCGSSATVDPEIIAVFPPEGRRWTYEAENEVIIALDRLDAAREQRGETQRDLEAIPKKGPASAVHAARRRWLQVQVELEETQIEEAETSVECARRNLELTRARLAVRFDLPVEEGFVKPFERRYLDCARTREDISRRALQLETKVRTSKRAWYEARAAYVAKTGDHDHGLWID